MTCHALAVQPRITTNRRGSAVHAWHGVVTRIGIVDCMCTGRGTGWITRRLQLPRLLLLSAVPQAPEPL